MIDIERISFEDARRLAQEYAMVLPIEQSEVWSNYQATIPGREPWGVLAISKDKVLLAILSCIAYHTHGYTYLRSLHGPVWVSQPTKETEAAVLQELQKFIRATDKSVVFIRLGAWYDTVAQPVLSTIPYDSTVVVPLEGTSDEILAQMRKRGRYDVRKALRESPAECADETQQAIQSFDEYYQVMVDTAHRDGFTPASKNTYHDMLTTLGTEHCRLYAGRINGEISNWCIITINDNRAVYYYGCMRTDMRKLRAPDKLFFFIFNDLAQQGILSIDLMGIGSDNYPALNTLNQFKTKFTEEITAVAPDRDVPVQSVMYRTLQILKNAKNLLKK